MNSVDYLVASEVLHPIHNVLAVAKQLFHFHIVHIHLQISVSAAKPHIFHRNDRGEKFLGYFSIGSQAGWEPIETKSHGGWGWVGGDYDSLLHNSMF